MQFSSYLTEKYEVIHRFCCLSLCFAHIMKWKCLFSTLKGDRWHNVSCLYLLNKSWCVTVGMSILVPWRHTVFKSLYNSIYKAKDSSHHCVSYAYVHLDVCRKLQKLFIRSECTGWTFYSPFMINFKRRLCTLNSSKKKLGNTRSVILVIWCM